jgi:hypothetical protein
MSDIKNQLRVCCIQCFKATEDMLSNLVIQKDRIGGFYEVKCMMSAFNRITGEAWIYAQLGRIRQSVLEKVLQEYGASQIIITTPSKHDFVVFASGCLKSVVSKSKTHGFELIRRGTPALYAHI